MMYTFDAHFEGEFEARAAATHLLTHANVNTYPVSGRR